ncbi:MAG: hypothetical protein OQK04_03530 [Kangiellaceae bacterium]|nr:hypothetical protein [Kangiellaceae bacterium]MCW8997764.1 hypothetical protein [Kangiellaceae bacterium]
MTRGQVFSTRCCATNARLEHDIAITQREKLLGLNKNGVDMEPTKFSPCAISLTPWKLEKTQFEQAIETSRNFSRLLQSLSQNIDLLLALLNNFQDKDSLLFKLKEQIASRNRKSDYLSENLNLSRYDFLLNNNDQWQLVESNAIAAGMGPFSEKLGELCEEYPIEKSQRLAQNPSIGKQAGAMYQAASRLNNTRSPGIVFVIEQNEDNIFDQNYLIEELERLGAKTLRRTFNELSNSLFSKDNRLRLKDFGEIDLLYFRTGYNLQDYSEDIPEKNIQLRDWIEKHRVIVSPSIAHQISSSKWVQIKLANMAENELTDRFSLTAKEALQIKLSLAVKYELVENIWQVKRALQSGDWLLKNQNEGGGNVTDDMSALPDIETLQQSYFLMEKIESKLRSNVCRFSGYAIECLSQVVSELGIFMVGDEHEYGGYLLRSKPFGQVEGGVHGGNGFLDVVAFDEKPRARILTCC